MSSVALVVALIVGSVHASNQKVVGGEEVSPGDWPDVAAIWYGDEVLCTGVLIAPDLVLTAGHCAKGITEVTLNSTDFADHGETIAVTKIIKYPHPYKSYDIGVLELEHESTVTPRMIAQDCILDDYLSVGSVASIVGYGATDFWGDEFDSVLMEARTSVTDPDCEKLSDGCVPGVSPGGELAAGGNGIDSCFGDSGGPLYLNTPEGDYLVGITSRSFDWVNIPCKHGGIYVRPDAVIDWIESETGREIPRPECDNTVEDDTSVDAPDANDPEDPDRREVGGCGCDADGPQNPWYAILLTLMLAFKRGR